MLNAEKRSPARKLSRRMTHCAGVISFMHNRHSSKDVNT